MNIIFDLFPFSNLPLAMCFIIWSFVFFIANSDIFEDNSIRIAVNVEVFQEFIKYRYFVAICASKTQGNR